jgi:16S rRNA (uracil1498-N3)-methyltransferase
MQQYFAHKKINNTFTFSKSDNHHLLNVMRIKENEEILVVYKEKKYLCNVKIINKEINALISKEVNLFNELDVDITLIYGLPKGDKFEFVIQKACELGVSRIVPFLSKRSVVKIKDNEKEKKLLRWNKIALEACKQAKRNKLVEVKEITSLNDLKEYKSKLNLIAYEEKSNEGSNNLFSLLNKKQESITIVVGPEGGFDKSEVNYFLDNEFISVSLGKRILRSETAPIYLLSVISFMQERDKNE